VGEGVSLLPVLTNVMVNSSCVEHTNPYYSEVLNVNVIEIKETYISFLKNTNITL
jgi:hypothetical protein